MNVVGEISNGNVKRNDEKIDLEVVPCGTEQDYFCLFIVDMENLCFRVEISVRHGIY